MLLLQVGKAFAKDNSVVIAKLDATLNDVTSPKFEVGPLLALLLKIPTQILSPLCALQRSDSLVASLDTNSGACV